MNKWQGERTTQLLACFLLFLLFLRGVPVKQERVRGRYRGRCKNRKESLAVLNKFKSGNL